MQEQKKISEAMCTWLFRRIDQMRQMSEGWSKRLPGHCGSRYSSLGGEGRKAISPTVFALAPRHQDDVCLSASSTPMAALLSSLPKSSWSLFWLISKLSVKIWSIWSTGIILNMCWIQQRKEGKKENFVSILIFFWNWSFWVYISKEHFI